MRLSRRVALFAGPALMLAVWLAPTPEGLSESGQAALATLALCVTWWLFTPVALAVTGLVGLAMLALLGALPTAEALALFGNQAVFFVIGVFLVASALYHTGLSARLTLLGLRRFARNEDVLALAVLGLSWGLCLFMVSHAVAAIMLPLVIELIRALGLDHRSRTARRLLLSMAWGTVTGSNLGMLSSARASLAIELWDRYRHDAGLDAAPMGIVAYSAGTAPVAVFGLLVAAAVLRLAFPPEGIDVRPAFERLDARVREMGPWTRDQLLTLAVIVAMVATMVVAGPAWLGVLSLVFSGLLFALQILRWEDAERYVNWGVALMYGGAIAVGAALHRTGATEWLAARLLPGAGVPAVVALLVIAAATAAFTEVVSNSAVMAVVLPIAWPLAEQTGIAPRSLAWIVPAAAGFAFVLPSSTPAMAMVFGTGYLRVRHTLVGVAITLASLAFLLVMARWAWPAVGFEVLPP